MESVKLRRGGPLLASSELSPSLGTRAAGNDLERHTRSKSNAHSITAGEHRRGLAAASAEHGQRGGALRGESRAHAARGLGPRGLFVRRLVSQSRTLNSEMNTWHLDYHFWSFIREWVETRVCDARSRLTRRLFNVPRDDFRPGTTSRTSSRSRRKAGVRERLFRISNSGL